MYYGDCFDKVKDAELYTVSRAKKEHICIDAENVCGWYHVWYGYVPMFRTVKEEEKVHNDKP